MNKTRSNLVSGCKSKNVMLIRQPAFRHRSMEIRQLGFIRRLFVKHRLLSVNVKILVQDH